MSEQGLSLEFIDCHLLSAMHIGVRGKDETTLWMAILSWGMGILVLESTMDKTQHALENGVWHTEENSQLKLRTCSAQFVHAFHSHS